jgi:hypothetical protein
MAKNNSSYLPTNWREQTRIIILPKYFTTTVKNLVGLTQTPNHKLIGSCPKCKSEVLEGNTGYFCRAQGCGFKLGGVVMGQFLNSSQASKLFREGRTDLLSEFISKHGRQFSAYLIVDEFGDVRFDFPKRDSQEFAAQPKPAAAS